MVNPFNYDPTWVSRAMGHSNILSGMVLATGIDMPTPEMSVWYTGWTNTGEGGVALNDTLQDRPPHYPSGDCMAPSALMQPPEPFHVEPGLWHIRPANGTSQYFMVPRNLPEGSQWWIRLAQGWTYRIRIPQEPQTPPMPPSPPSAIPSMVTSPGSPSSNGLISPNALGPHSQPDFAFDMTFDSIFDANGYLGMPFDPELFASPATNHDYDYLFGHAHSMSYPTEEPQVAAPGTDLTANNILSTGATLTGGALEGDAGRATPSPTSAAQAAANPASSGRSEPADNATNYEHLCCSWPGCNARTREGKWRGMPRFATRQRLDTHVKAKHEMIKTGQCDKCGKSFSRGDSASRHKKGACEKKAQKKIAKLASEEAVRNGTGRAQQRAKGGAKAQKKAGAKAPKKGGAPNQGKRDDFDDDWASSQAGPSRLPF